MNPITAAQVQQWVRIGIYTASGALMKHGYDTSGYIEIVLSIALFLVNGAWTLWGTRINAKIAEVAAYAKIPGTPVQGVITSNSEEGKKLASTTDGAIAPEGSPTAKKMASTHS